jgi:hypothetical protein
MWKVWADYRDEGYSLRAVAALVDQPLTTVVRGLAKFKAWLVETCAADASDYVAPCMPIFGPASWPANGLTGEETDKQKPLNCPACGDVVNADGIICATCSRVNPVNERKLDHQRKQAESLRVRRLANWKATQHSPRPKSV